MTCWKNLPCPIRIFLLNISTTTRQDCTLPETGKNGISFTIFTGREIAAALLEINYKGEYFSLSGYIGKPVINRGNRNYENYFINGRYIKSSLLSRSIEEAYHNFLMQHQYPFTVLYFTFPGDTLDVNVHPTKMELRFGHNQEIYKELCDVLFGLLSHKELIPEVPVDEAEHKKKNLPRHTKNRFRNHLKSGESMKSDSSITSLRFRKNQLSLWLRLCHQKKHRHLSRMCHSIRIKPWYGNPLTRSQSGRNPSLLQIFAENNQLRTDDTCRCFTGIFNG